MEEWVQWTIGTLIALGSLVLAYFSFRKKPEATEKQKVSKNNLQQSPVAQSIHSQVNHFEAEPKPEPVKTAPEEKISERDKKIIHHLFTEVLDLDMAQDTLHLQAAWYGYPKKAIYSLTNYEKEVEKLSNRVSNKVFREKIETFTKSLKTFLRECGSLVSDYDSNHRYYFIGRQDSASYEESEKALQKSKEIDKLASEAYGHLVVLIDLSRQNDLI